MRASGLSAQDHDIANELRRLGKPCVLAANKAEGMTRRRQAGRVLRTGLRRGARASRPRTGRASAAWSTLALEPLNLPEPRKTRTRPRTPTSRSSWPWPGRPNVGKSTLINTWLGEERLVAFDLPGTTRDAISVPFERNGQRFELIDTAGLRRKGKVFEAIEKFSVVKTLQAIESANVVLLLLDATQGVTDQDAHIAGYILESGRAVVIAINKWDAVDSYQREQIQRQIETRLAVPEVRVAALHLGHQAPGPGPGLAGDRAGPQVGHAQDVDAGADAPAAGGRAVPGAQARRACSAPSCAMRTRAA